MPHSIRSRFGDPRRLLTLLLALCLLATAVAIRTTGNDSSSLFISAACFRIGLVFLAIWFAWESLRRPASWFPPAVLAGGVGVLALVAAQPRLILVLGPALGMIVTIGAVVRTMRRRS